MSISVVGMTATGSSSSVAEGTGALLSVTGGNTPPPLLRFLVRAERMILILLGGRGRQTASR